VDKIADSLSIDNRLAFKKNQDGIEDMFRTERNARVSYSQKIRLKEDTTSNYFTDKEDGKQNS
jgi:hypothetical protein